MNEYNRGGFYIFQAYFYAALNYFYYTGDTKPLSEVINPEEIISPELLRLYRENRGWLIANQDVYRLQVTTAGINDRSKNGRQILRYQARRRIRDEAVFYVPETGEKLPIDKFLKTGEEEYASSVRSTCAAAGCWWKTIRTPRRCTLRDSPLKG